MEALDTLRQWLLTYPRWEEGGLLYIDYTDALPGSCGLFSNGLEEQKRYEDLLGNVTVHNRYHFTLYRMTTGQEDNTANAKWLLDFQKWVQEQSLLHLAPTFGDAPSRERILAQKGRLRRDNQTGTATYAVNLTVDFVKYYVN